MLAGFMSVTPPAHAGASQDYSWAVVGSRDRAYLWVLGRRADLTKGELAAALATARAVMYE